MHSPPYRQARPAPPSRAVRYLMLMALIVGTVLAAMGNFKSHGLAAIHASQHVAPCCQEEPPGHAHHDDGGHGTTEHAHHGADHSHDKAHALPRAWGSAAALPPSWLAQAPPWLERVEASRLERPPRA